MSTDSLDSLPPIVDKGWVFVSLNTAILAFVFCGVISTLMEAAGYWPTIEFTEFFQIVEREMADKIHTEGSYPELKDAVFKFLDMLKTARLYTMHIYLAAYILLPYPLITERQKVLLTPWLICSMLRSVLLNLLMTLAGVILCAAQSTLHFPCLQYSALRGVEFSMSLYVWTNVHNFYHLLDGRYTVERVMKSFERTGKRPTLTMSDTSFSSTLVSLNSEEFEDLGMEATLVELAAKAWIAREILENGDEYVTDSQFNKYLALKATMELRQILKDIAEKKKDERRKKRTLSVKERIIDSLDIYKHVTKQEKTEAPVSKIEAFEQSKDLSRRDPIRRIPPLQPHLQSSETIDLSSPKRNDPKNKMSPPSSTRQENVTERSVEIQTDPLSPEMIELFDALEKHQASQI